MFVVLVARVTMATIVNARAGLLLFSCFSDVIFPFFRALFTKNLRPKSKF